VRSRDFCFRVRGFLRLISNDGSLIHFSTLRKGRKRRKRLMVLSNKQQINIRIQGKNIAVEKSKEHNSKEKITYFGKGVAAAVWIHATRRWNLVLLA
jgi:hypothetical protein